VIANTIAIIVGLAYASYFLLQTAYLLDHLPYCGGRKWWWRIAEYDPPWWR